MRPFSSKKRSRVAVFLHDGEAWHVFVFAHAKPRWKTVAQTTFQGTNQRQIPPSMVDFAEKNGAQRIRVAVPREVVTLNNISLPYDASPEELQTVVASALTAETGMEFGTVRVAGAMAESFRMGGHHETIFGAAFENDLLEQFDKTCHGVRLHLEGVGVLELALLAANCELNPGSRFLMLRRDSGFYAVPATENLPMMASGIALGCAADERGREPERLQRAARRLETHAATPLHIACAVPLSTERRLELVEILGPDTQYHFDDYAAMLETAAAKLAASGPVSAPTTGGAVVGMTEEVTSPYRAGTWMFFIAMIAACFFVWLTHNKLTDEMAHIQAQTTAWEALKAERKKQSDALNALNTQRTKYEKTIELMNDREILPAGVQTILAELEENMPVATRLTRIDQTGPLEFQLSGFTFSQDVFLQIVPRLNEILRKYEMSAELKKLEKLPHSREQEFLVRVYK